MNQDEQDSDQIPQDQEQGQGEMLVSNAWEEIAAARRITFEDIKQHMTGPVLSVCLHIILITLLMTFIVGGPEEHTAEITVDIKEMDIKEIEKLPEPPPEEEQVFDESVEVDSPTNSTSTAPSESTSVGSTADVSVGFSDAPDARVSNILSIAPSNSPLVLPGVMAGRTAGGRRTALSRFGGSSRTELAAMKGLRWLRDHQNDDGSWGEDASRKPAYTGFATLAFLAHGETPSSAEFGACVLKAIKKLVEYSETASPVQTCGGNGYGHPIVTYALSEAYALTKIPMLETAVNKMIDYTVKGQNAVGGFDYWYGTSGRCDLSVMGWANQAMKAAFAAGSTTPNLEAAIEKAVQCVKTQQRDSVSGGFVYSTNIGTPGGGAGVNMTAVGTLCLFLLGEGKSSEAAGGLKWLKDKCWAVSWDAEEAAKGGGTGYALYRWYYQTQAFFQGNSGTGPDWKAWNKMFTTALLKNQASDGHWVSPASGAGAGKGAVAAGGEAGTGIDDAIYSTALCTLMLEVYYRYLPTFKVVVSAAPVAGATDKAADSTDIIIK